MTWFAAASGGSALANPTLNAVGAVTYYAQSTLGSCNSFSRTPVTLTIDPTPDAPVSGGNQIQCALNPIQTLTATATGSTISWFNLASGGILVANPNLNAVGSVTYYSQATLGSCNSLSRTPVSLTINTTPTAPVSDGDQVQCKQTPVQTLTATATGNSVTWYNASIGGSLVANPILNSVGTIAYYAQATIGSCNSLTRTTVTLTINDLPAAPAVCVIEPSLCGPSTGSITFLSPVGQGIQFSIDIGTTWQSSATFNNLAAGSVTGIQVQDINGCYSSKVDCNESTCSEKPAPEENTLSADQYRSITKVTESIHLQTASVNVYPNPFDDKIKFQVNVPGPGNCTLEVFTLMGQKVKTIYSGFIPAGEKTFETSFTGILPGYYLYKLKTEQTLLTGKLLKVDQ